MQRMTVMTVGENREVYFTGASVTVELCTECGPSRIEDV